MLIFILHPIMSNISKFNLRGVKYNLFVIYLRSLIEKLPFPRIIPFGENALRLEFPGKPDGTAVNENELIPHLDGSSGKCYETIVS